MKRRYFFSTASAGVMASAWAYGVEPHNFELTDREIKLPGVRPKRLLHVADFHTSDGLSAPELDAAMRPALARKPDLICLTGDFISTTYGYDASGLSTLLRRAADSAPTFADPPEAHCGRRARG